jgi:hypothetical protein
MRKFIGHQLQFLIDGSKVEGEFLGEGKDDEKGLLILRDKDGTIWRIPKGKIGPFRYADASSEDSDYVPFLILTCQNPSTKCPGVQFIKEGNGFKQSDFELFMGECPCKCDTCRFGSAGELRSVKGSTLRGMLADTRFGEYPEEGKSNAGRTANGKTKRADS